MTTEPNRNFLFVTCQVGAEAALKAELAMRWPAFRFAYSRPGFLTFKLPADHALTDDFDLHSLFARTYGFSLGKVRADAAPSEDESQAFLARQAWRLAEHLPVDRLHVWQRDTAAPGHRGFEPGPTPNSDRAERAMLEAASEMRGAEAATTLREPTRPGDRVLDCVLVEPHEWWIGWHQAQSLRSCWSGGIPRLTPPDDMVSRAYLKMEEALAWSGLPVEEGHVAVEIGSSPGGAAQSLLNRGLIVIGVDPAEMDSYVLAHPNFTHVRKRGSEVRRREFRGVHWLIADVNVAPAYTLEMVESIVTHRDVEIEGLLLTLKLLDVRLAEELPTHLLRIRGWGFGDVRARQLGYNRQEVCVSAFRNRSLRQLQTRSAAPRSVPE